MTNELPDSPCPSCGSPGCVGYCDEPDGYDSRTSGGPYTCTVCCVAWVDAANGYDTCTDCLRKA